MQPAPLLMPAEWAIRGCGISFLLRASGRCQAITVSGLTITSADCQPFHRRESQTHKSRSAIPKRSRWPRLNRWRTMSCWQRASISACSAARVRNPCRIEENGDRKCPDHRSVSVVAPRGSRRSSYEASRAFKAVMVPGFAFILRQTPFSSYDSLSTWMFLRMSASTPSLP
jgi:hypothetical protein